MDKRTADISKNKGKSPVPYIIMLVFVLIAFMATGCSEPEKGKSFQLEGKETRPVLDPAMFSGMTRLAYEAAKQYPDALNEVFCYCYCNEPPFKHKSLLSCFVDKHGAG